MTSHQDPRFFALLPCAGTGSRAGTAQPKQYEPIVGKPLVLHTLAAFLSTPRIDEVWAVVAPGDLFLPAAADAVRVAPCGGASRAESVRNGLLALKASGALDTDWVLVHDAARCLITPQEIEALIASCEGDEVGGLLALKLPDTLKSGQGDRVSETLDRSDKWLAQTPQMFRLAPLLAALQAQAGTGFEGVTDEASAMELAGQSPKLVPGSAQNFKVTYPEDFALADAILRSRK
ncbi:MAG: 2-C-methyl-D-erythritol 4-phosphate cytidylyltransferase [Burkholderiaceae bacterium]